MLRFCRPPDRRRPTKPQGARMEVCNMKEQKRNEIIKTFSDVDLSVERADEVVSELYNVLKEKGLSVKQAETLLDFTKDLIWMTVIIR